jgi:hypothetical protein
VANLTCRVPQDWLDTLRHAAIDRRTTATAIVLDAVTQYLNTKESATVTESTAMSMLDAVTELRRQGYDIVVTNAEDYEITDYINACDDDGPQVVMHEADNGSVRLVELKPDGYLKTNCDTVTVWREADYLKHKAE